MRNYTPTAALPGSREKIDVIAARIAARQPSDHPSDLLEDDRRGITFKEHSNCKPDVNSKRQASQSGSLLRPTQQPMHSYQIFRKKRRLLGLSLRQVSQRTKRRGRGLAPSTIQRIECGEIRPDWHTFCRLAMALEMACHLDDCQLAYDDDEAEAPSP